MTSMNGNPGRAAIRPDPATTLILQMLMPHPAGCGLIGVPIVVPPALMTRLATPGRAAAVEQFQAAVLNTVGAMLGTYVKERDRIREQP